MNILTAAEKAHNHSKYLKMKDNPERYAAYLTALRKRKRLRRSQMTPEQRRLDRGKDHKRSRPDSLVWRVAQWRRRHRERAREYPGGNDLATLTASEWLDVLDSQGNRCASCGRVFGADLEPTVDHLTPVVVGGTLTRDNVQALCGPCNSARHHQLIQEALLAYFPKAA